MNTGSLAAAPSRLERKKERTRLEILHAATRVLARKGLHATKITDIAAAADVGVGTFYLHFDTKEALFAAVVEETVARLKATVDEARTSVSDPVERVVVSNRALCRFAQENREVFKIVFGHGAAHHETIRRAQAQFAADIEENLREGMDAGRFGTLPTVLTAQALVGMSTQLLAWWSEHDDSPIELLERTLLTLTLRGLGPAAEEQPCTKAP